MTNDSAPEILIVSTKVDIATEYVALKLSTLGARFARINTEDFPLTAISTYQVGGSNKLQSWHWTSSTNISLDAVRTVWYRRHRLPRMPEEVEEAHAEYCLREAEWFLKGGIYSLDARKVAWMSNPAKIQIAESKIYQLTTAQSLDLKTPETLISNDPNEIRDFFQKKGGRIIAKPLRLGYFDYGHKQTAVYTNQVEWKHLKDDDSIKVAPVIYQEWLPKRYDIRVTIVGRRIFAVAIDSQIIDSARIDWRRTDTENLPHSVHTLPPFLERKCLEYMDILGLTYGALDFVLRPDGEYLFLEVNPNGQWVWMEDKLGLPISESIATWLIEHSQN